MTLLVVALAACLALAALVLVPWVTTATGAPSFTQDLVAPDDGAAAERVRLEDGTELAVTVVEEEFVVQWRGPGESSWTPPEEVVDGWGLDADAISVDVGGSTAALGLSSYAWDDDERETHARTDAVICRDYGCGTVAEDLSGVPSLTDDGAYAVAPDEDDDGGDTQVDPTYDVSRWNLEDDEWSSAVVDSPAEGDDVITRPDLVLVGDGTLATVRPDTADGACRYALWTTEPRGTELEVAATSGPAGGGSCGLQFVQAAEGRVVFDVPAAAQAASFRRSGDGSGDGWVDDLPDSTLVTTTGSGFGPYPTTLEDGSTVAVASRDGREVLTQYRPAGEVEWTRPRVVARAAAGQRCRSTEPQDVYDRTDVVYAVACWPTASRWGGLYDETPPPSTGFALGSSDGRRWDAEALVRPAYAPEEQTADKLLLVRGGERSVFWRPGAEAFDEVRLPLANPTLDSLTITGDSAIRVTGNPDADAPCRPEWSVASLDAGQWQDGGEIGPISAFSRQPGRCYGASSDEEENGRTGRRGRLFRVVGIGLTTSVEVDGQLVRRGDGWTFRPGAD